LLGAAFLIMALVDIALTDVSFETILYRAVDLVYFTSYFLLAWSGNFLAKAAEGPIGSPERDVQQ